MDAPIHASYTPTHEEIWITQRRAAQYVFPRGFKYRFWFVLILLIVLFAGFFEFLYSDEMQAALARHMGEVIAKLTPPILALALIISGRSRFGRWVQRFFNKGLDQRAPLPALNFTAGENRLEWTSKHSSSWLEYEAIERLFLTPKTLGIISGGSVISLPRRALDENGGLSSVVNFIFGHLRFEARDASLQDEGISSFVWWHGPVEQNL